MTDIAITVAREKWPTLLQVLGAADPRGRTHSFDLFGDRPAASNGDLLYIVSHGRLRCVFEIERTFPHRGHWQVVGSFLRPVTLAGFVPGFSEWRRRWWDRQHELAFADWRTEAVSLPIEEANGHAYAHGKARGEQGGASA